MAEGRSNGGIAGQLFVTPKAVEKHIANIFGKLGLHADVSEDHRRVLAVLTYLRSRATASDVNRALVARLVSPRPRWRCRDEPGSRREVVAAAAGGGLDRRGVPGAGGRPRRRRRGGPAAAAAVRGRGRGGGGDGRGPQADRPARPRAHPPPAHHAVLGARPDDGAGRGRARSRRRCPGSRRCWPKAPARSAPWCGWSSTTGWSRRGLIPGGRPAGGRRGQPRGAARPARHRPRGAGARRHGAASRADDREAGRPDHPGRPAAHAGRGRRRRPPAAQRAAGRRAARARAPGRRAGRAAARVAAAADPRPGGGAAAADRRAVARDDGAARRAARRARRCRGRPGRRPPEPGRRAGRAGPGPRRAGRTAGAVPGHRPRCVPRGAARPGARSPRSTR